MWQLLPLADQSQVLLNLLLLLLLLLIIFLGRVNSKMGEDKKMAEKTGKPSEQTVGQDKGGGVNKKLGSNAIRCSNEAIVRDNVSRTESRLLNKPFQTWKRCKETHLKWLCGWFPQGPSIQSPWRFDRRPHPLIGGTAKGRIGHEKSHRKTSRRKMKNSRRRL